MNAFFWSVFLLSMTLMAISPSVDAGAILKLSLTKWTGNGKKANGDCCDIFCNKCDPFFQFALDTSSSSDSADQCNVCYWKATTGFFQDKNEVTLESTIGGVQNPIVHTFSSWPGSVKFKVYVWDKDVNFDDPLDGMLRLLQRDPATTESAASWIPESLSGKVSSLSMSYKLYCEPNYYTKSCSVHCVSQDSDTDGHYTCDPTTGSKVCRSGWEDVSNLCKTFSDDCIGNLCENGATCVDGVRDYTCRCLPGFNGKYCEIDINDCANNPCLNGGTCIDLVNGFQCNCLPAFTGNKCATPYCHVNNPCRNGGTCYEAGLCRCPGGFTGSDCAVDLCDAVNCQNEGTCISGNCNCSPGYTGIYCQTDINECASNPCDNDGTCTDVANGYKCTCSSEFLGPTCSTPYCETTNPCRNGGTCHGAGLCQCPDGFIGPDCSVNPCDGVNCQNGGTCVAGACSCALGYSGDQCEIDINECESDPCLNGGTCEDLVGGFQCTCTASFVGVICNGSYCQSNNPCINGGTCYNAGLCQCAPGFTGQDCSTIDVCRDVLCQNGGTCVAGSCVCADGFEGATCDVVQCSAECQNDGVCVNGTCQCTNGFTGDQCEEEINDCVSDPCLNNGTCKDQLNGFKCTCTESFVGPTCSEPYCQSNNPCRNGGTCYGPGLCHCAPGFAGADCSQPVIEDDDGECESIVCHNGGTCVNGVCHCETGFIGESCQFLDCPSAENCLNGGVFVNRSCSCSAGYSGDRCEVDVDECASGPCLNGGTCTDLINGFRCNCTTQFIGTRCSVPYCEAVSKLLNVLDGYNNNNSNKK